MFGLDTTNCPVLSFLLGAELSTSGPHFCLTLLNLSSAAACFFFPDAYSSFTSASHHFLKLFFFLVSLSNCEMAKTGAGSVSRTAGTVGRRVVGALGKTCKDRIAGRDWGAQGALGMQRSTLPSRPV